MNFCHSIAILFFAPKMRRLLASCLHANCAPRSIGRMRPLMRFSSLFGNCEGRPHTNSITTFFFNWSKILKFRFCFSHICLCFVRHHLVTQVPIILNNSCFAGVHSILVVDCIFNIHPVQLLLLQVFVSENLIPKRPYE